MILVDNVFKLEKAQQAIVNSDVAGVDIETYDYKGKPFGKIRLVQVAVGDEVFVFDLFKVSFPDFLREFFASKEKTKVFHYGFFDMSHLIKYFDCIFENTFCTANATKVLSCGLNVGYSLKSVVEAFLGEQIDKTEQTSDWGGELTESQIAYASKDASVLLKLFKVQSAYIEKKRLKKIFSLENALQRVSAENFAKRFYPPEEDSDKVLKEIEENYFKGIDIEEIEKAGKLPLSVQEKKKEYFFLKKLLNEGFYPDFSTNWKTNGFFFQKNYTPELKNYFSPVKVIKFFNLELPAIHANAKDFKSVELYSQKDFFDTREFLLLKAVGLRDFDSIGEFRHLIDDFQKEIPGIITWHKKMFARLAERKPVRIAGGKIIHTKHFDISQNDKEGFISFLITANISDFLKSTVVLIEKFGGRVLQFNVSAPEIEFIAEDRGIAEKAIEKSSELFFGEKLLPHFYDIVV